MCERLLRLQFPAGSGTAPSHPRVVSARYTRSRRSTCAWANGYLVSATDLSGETLHLCKCSTKQGLYSYVPNYPICFSLTHHHLYLLYHRTKFFVMICSVYGLDNIISMSRYIFRLTWYMHLLNYSVYPHTLVSVEYFSTSLWGPREEQGGSHVCPLGAYGPAAMCPVSS